MVREKKTCENEIDYDGYDLSDDILPVMQKL